MDHTHVFHIGWHWSTFKFSGQVSLKSPILFTSSPAPAYRHIHVCTKQLFQLSFPDISIPAYFSLFYQHHHSHRTSRVQLTISLINYFVSSNTIKKLPIERALFAYCQMKLRGGSMTSVFFMLVFVLMHLAKKHFMENIFWYYWVSSHLSSAPFSNISPNISHPSLCL